jgi:hypothetical protein
MRTLLRRIKRLEITTKRSEEPKLRLKCLRVKYRSLIKNGG